MGPQPRTAWEPITPRGVAAFALASNRRLWLVQSVAAGCVAVAVMWLLATAVFPALRTAIERLPSDGQIRFGRLEWQGESPLRLAESRAIAFSVDLQHRGAVRSPAHIEIELGESRWRIHSLLGYVELSYPSGWIIAMNRGELEPWWGAREVAVLAITGVVILLWLLLIWAGLACVYVPPVWVFAFYADIDLSIPASWRLAGAALMPGALVMVLAIIAYGQGWVDLIGLAALILLHLVVGWVYLFASLPWVEARKLGKKNPFA